MVDDESRLGGLIDRLQADDGPARRELVALLYSRLCRLTAGLQRSFPILRGHEPESVLHAAWARLDRAIAQTQPASTPDLFRLSAHVIHRVLIDMAAQARKHLAREGAKPGLAGDDPSGLSPLDPAHDSWDPARLAVWSEFHEHVEQLPGDERDVFEMHYYLGLTQSEVARLLDRHPRSVSRQWVAATERLADHVPDVTRRF